MKRKEKYERNPLVAAREILDEEKEELKRMEKELTEYKEKHKIKYIDSPAYYKVKRLTQSLLDFSYGL